MSFSGLQVIVIGGGVAGLAVTAALRQRGADVLVLEQAGGFREVGAGLQISPNGARVVRALGLAGALDQMALRSQAVELRAGHDGARVLRIDLPQDGAGFHLIHRADLIDLLAQGLDGAETRFVAQVAQVNPQGPRPSVMLKGGEALSADLVVGADGLHSVLRPVLQPGTPKTPFFTGQVAWRAVIPGDDGAPEAQLFAGPGRHLVSYPLRGGSLRNIVAVEERRGWAAAEGWNHPDSPANLRTAFAGFGGPVPGWLAQVEKLYLWGLFRHPVATHWHQGHAAILGDAAHPTLPFMAQGANLALEDAWVLAAMLDRHPIAQALAAYQQARRARAARVIEAANRNARNYHLRAPLARVAHGILRVSSRLQPDGMLKRLGWIYDFDVTQP